MPVPKRWCPVSRDINDDPEVWELTIAFGDRALRIQLEVIAILDRTENEWRLTSHWLTSLSRKVRQQPATVQRVIDWMLAKGWLTVGQTAPDGSPAVLSSPNYWKYHKRREPKGRQTGPLPSLPYLDLTSPPKVPPVSEEALARFEEFRKAYPARGGMKFGMDRARVKFLKLSPDDQPQCIAATKAYAKGCANGERKPKDPDHFLEQDGCEPWRELIPSKPTPPAPKPPDPPIHTRPAEEIRKDLDQTTLGRFAADMAERHAAEPDDAPAEVQTSAKVNR